MSFIPIDFRSSNLIFYEYPISDYHYSKGGQINQDPMVSEGSIVRFSQESIASLYLSVSMGSTTQFDADSLPGNCVTVVLTQQVIEHANIAGK